MFKTLFGMLEQGWKIKKFIYRGIKTSRFSDPSYGMPLWVTLSGQNREFLKYTAWFEMTEEDLPRWIGGPFVNTGFNHVILVKEDD